MNEDRSVTCPCCLNDYSKLDNPDEFYRVLHVLNPRHDQQSRLARLSAEVLAKDKLPQMSKEEQDELMANINSAGTTNWPPMMEFKDLTPEDQKSVKDYIAINFYKPSILEQVCVGLREIGMDCTNQQYGEPCLVTRLAGDVGLLRFGPGLSTWEGRVITHYLDQWVSDISNDCRDVRRIVKMLSEWIKRFDYREHRP